MRQIERWLSTPGWISRGIPAEWFTFYLMLFAWVPPGWLQASVAYQRLGSHGSAISRDEA